MKQILGWILALWLSLTITEAIRRIVRARRRTARTAGRVVRVTMRRTWPNTPSPDVQFLDSVGDRREFSSSAGTSWDQWPVGAQVDVSFDPKDPSNAELSSAELLGSALVMLIVLGGIAAIVATLVLINVFDHIP